MAAMEETRLFQIAMSKDPLHAASLDAQAQPRQQQLCIACLDSGSYGVVYADEADPSQGIWVLVLNPFRSELQRTHDEVDAWVQPFMDIMYQQAWPDCLICCKRSMTAIEPFHSKKCLHSTMIQ